MVAMEPLAPAVVVAPAATAGEIPMPGTEATESSWLAAAAVAAVAAVGLTTVELEAQEAPATELSWVAVAPLGLEPRERVAIQRVAAAGSAESAALAGAGVVRQSRPLDRRVASLPQTIRA